MKVRLLLASSIAGASWLAPCPASGATLDGTVMGWPWALPFVGLLATIATGPLLFPKVWHRHYTLLAAFWSALTIAAIAVFASPAAALDAVLHAMLADYLSFIVVLLALFTVAGGILVTGNLRGAPHVNTLMIAIGTAIASFVGTTGAAMIMIRPLLRANESRAHNVHVMVFFIFLVANIGGALTPLGNPPLFVGFLAGVDFFWTARHLWFETLVTAGLVLAMFFAVDWWRFRSERSATIPMRAGVPGGIKVRGIVNLLLIAAIVGAIAMSAFWRPGVGVTFRGVTLELQNLIRDGVLLIIALASVRLTPDEHREANGFSWEPIREVAILFAGIFVCIVPVLAMLRAGEAGSFAWLLHLVTGRNGNPHDVAFFWLTGLLSAFLDNAPTYLVFFELAGGDPQVLMGPLAGTLAAISMGALYMGALTYLGNAPNLMVYAIATERGVRMPSFFGYMAWSTVVLLPVFGVLTIISIMKP